ncbi:MAG: AAA family ATPase, partial [Elusimicrobiaceae bacterium]|nr:AAA family ATPase [Elusimicrobiaceae bacterium]
MYLKAVEIIGFKSFAEKVRMSFEKGITCVVGPNGCGKSNVVDSIRWCIGEKSWKQLRSPSMIDIIFNGTAKRSPLNLAEVNMIFDNESRRLPIDFAEVTVTRRIYRSGESEYYLNKVQCRLRDVRDMFLDTGIGGEGYAIIDQGGVEFVLSAAPETRRDLFEEAAGVSKYKAKRDEAQRKLEKVDSDLARLMDSVALIDQQIRKLDTEAKKAKKYQKYKEELSEAEIALALDTIKRHSGALESCAQRLQPLQQQLENKNTRLSVLEGEVAALNLNLTHKQDEYSKYGEKISGVKYRIGILEGNIRNCDNLSAELVRQIESSRQEDEVSSVRMAQLDPAITRLKAELAVLAEQIAPLQSRYNEKTGQINAANGELAEIERDSEKASTDILRAAQREMECASKLALEESNLSHSAQDISESETDFEKTRIQREEAAAVVARLENEVKAQTEAIGAVRTELAALESGRAALVARRAELNDTVSAVRSRQAALNATMQIIRSQGEKDPYWVGTKTVCESGMAGVRGPLRRFLKINSGDTLFAEDALGRYLDSVICADFKAVESAVGLLRRKGGARCRFLVLSALTDEGGASADPGILKRLDYPAEYEKLLRNLLAGVSQNGTTVTDGFWVAGGADGVDSPEPYWAKEEEIRLELTS